MALNGRIPGDLSGAYTYHGPTASSTIDLALVTSDLRRSVKYLRVREPAFYSDHCPLTLCIGTGNRRINNNSNKDTLTPAEKFIWKKEHAENFKAILSSEHTRESFEKYCRTVYEDPNEASRSLTELIAGAARKICKTKRSGNKKLPQASTPGNRPVHDKSIQDAKCDFKKAKRDFQKEKHSLDRTATFLSAPSLVQNANTDALSPVYKSSIRNANCAH